MTRKQVALKFSMDPMTIRDWEKRGKIPVEAETLAGKVKSRFVKRDSVSAAEKIRTSTVFRPLPPQSSASTSFATAAFSQRFQKSWPTTLGRLQGSANLTDIKKIEKPFSRSIAPW